MKQLLIIFLILMVAVVGLRAQDEQSGLDSPVNRLDSVKQNKISAIDTTLNKVDKINRRFNSLNETLDDSLNVEQPGSELEQAKNNLTRKIDSLKEKNIPHHRYSKKLDSLIRIEPFRKIEDTQGNIHRVGDKVNKIESSPEGKINEKLNVLSKESDGQGNLPSDVNLPNAKLNGSADISKGGTPSLGLPNNPMDKGTLNPDKINSEIGIDKLGDLKTTVGVDEISEKVSGYSDDIKSISTGDLDDVNTLKKDAVSQLPTNPAGTSINEAEQVIGEQKVIIESLKNPEEYKKQTLARAKEMTIKQLSVYDQRLQETVGKISKYQKRAGTILSKKNDLPKRRDPLKKLKTYEKIVPGLTLQVKRPGAWLVDVNPSLRYRLTSYWSAGSGWNERIIIGSAGKPAERVRLYGIRNFTEVIVFKGFAARIDVELMNSFVMPNLQHQDVGEREWKWGYIAGIKKEFSFVPKVIGNVQFMYNLYDPKNQSPYPTRFNVRFGFELQVKKKKNRDSKQNSNQIKV